MTQVDFNRATSPCEAGLDPFVKLDKGAIVGRVTSACASPTPGGALAFAYVATDVGGPLTVDGVARAAERGPLPFYDPERHRVRAVAGR